MSKAFDIEDINNMSDYASKEYVVTAQDQQIVDIFISQTQTMSLSDKSSIISLLQQIKIIALQNKQQIDIMKTNMEAAKSLLKQEIEELQSNSTLNDLYRYKNKINQLVLSISAEQFNIAYARIQELRYRQNALEYKIQSVKAQTDAIDNSIEVINKYIIALQTL